MYRIVGIAAAAVVMSAVMTAPANAAAPEFGRCVKQAGGVFENSGCTKKAATSGKYEWLPGAVKGGFTMTLAPEFGVVMETAKGRPLACKGAHGSGVVSSPTTVSHVSVTFTECESTQLVECGGPGLLPREVVTQELDGSLGVYKAEVEPQRDKVAVEWKTEAPTGNLIAEWECTGGQLLQLSGSVLHQVPTGKMSATVKEAFRQAKGEQAPECFLPCTRDERNMYLSHNKGLPIEEIAWGTTFVTTYEEPLEVNPVA
jgi:hypothetical protein